MAVSGVNGAQGASATSAPQYVRNSDGSITITFNGKKQKVTGKDAERYTETFNKVYAVPMKIAELEGKLAAKGISASDKAKYEKELKELKEKDRQIKSSVAIEISPDGKTVNLTLKKDMKAEDLKKLFNIDDGVFRETLKKGALADGIGVEGKVYSPNDTDKPYGSYDEALMTMHGAFWNPGESISFSNGVKLVASDDAGHYYPDYTGGILDGGVTYSISESYIDDGKPWYQFW